MADSSSMRPNDGEQEEWRAVMVQERTLAVSSHGRVRDERGKLKRLTHRADGYRTTGVMTRGGVLTLYVHRLVAAAFLGPCPEGAEVRHLYGTSRGDGVANLAYGTTADNRKDTALAGVMMRGEAHPNAKFTEKTVLALRQLRPFMPASVLAAWLDVAAGSVSKVQTGERWAHVRGSMTTEDALRHVFGGAMRVS